MPDITMCRAHKCYFRDQCARYTNTRSVPQQSEDDFTKYYHVFDHFGTPALTCQMFVPIRPEPEEG